MNKKLVIMSMCIAILIMIIGYSIFISNIKINGTANITSTWNILFTSIKEISKTSGVNVKEDPTISGTLATFNIGLNYPGDSIVYQITVENKGTIDAVINKINGIELGSDAIEFVIDGIKEGDKLGHGESKNFTVTIKFKEEVTKDPNLKDNELQIDITYVQDLSDKEQKDPSIIPTRLSQKILYDNEEQSDKDIDFSQISSDTNGKGLYYTNTNTQDNRVTYYFRGDVKNNYVYFGEFYWRIIRINEDGSIRLIYQGKEADATKEDATIGQSAFNSESDDNAYVGYMYGEIGSSSYEETHANKYNSTIKEKLDEWYHDNLLGFDNYIADAGFCNDRSLDLKNGNGTSKENTFYLARLRNIDAKEKPIFNCPNPKNDLFTVNNDKGNKALEEYPIGLITVDEVHYAGTIYSDEQDNKSFYLSNYPSFWTMSPSNFYNASVAKMMGISARHLWEWDSSISDRHYVIPVINLKANVEITSTTQNGTINNPYIIKMTK